jgi:hypothetical protein
VDFGLGSLSFNHVGRLFLGWFGWVLVVLVVGDEVGLEVVMCVCGNDELGFGEETSSGLEFKGSQSCACFACFP